MIRIAFSHMLMVSLSGSVVLSLFVWFLECILALLRRRLPGMGCWPISDPSCLSSPSSLLSVASNAELLVLPTLLLYLLLCALLCDQTRIDFPNG
jgi:hypothetical protein